MQELKAKIEAVLYCMPKGISTEKLATLCQIGSKGHLATAIKELKEDYEKRGAGLEISEENGMWSCKIKNEHLELVKEAARPELSQAVLGTLSYVAWKGSILQSELAKVRTEASKHIAQLMELGFVERARKAQTFLIKPTKKFYDYFQIKEGENLNLKETLPSEPL